MKKYELLNTGTKRLFGKTLFKIRALESFGYIKKGELGGYIEKESNLAQIDNAWVGDNAEVSGDAVIGGNAWVGGDAWVGGYAVIEGNAVVSGDADYLCIKGIGSEYRHTTAYRSKSGIEISCGCFQGTLQEFEAKVKSTHGESKFAKEYQLFTQLIKLHFGVEEKNN